MNKTNLQELLPLGSIVTLKKGTKKIMISKGKPPRKKFMIMRHVTIRKVF